MNLKKLIYLQCLLLFLIGVELKGQISISGKVKDNTNQVLIGASVLVKGATIGTTTDIDGNFTLQVPDEKASIVFSFVGMQSQQITVGKKRFFDVVLSDNQKLLDELVVVGYGTMKKSDLTGAVSSYKPDEKEIGKSLSIDNILKGKVAGLNISTTASAPGAASSVTIRGANSLRGDNQPLYVIDNIPQASAGEFVNNGNDGTFSIATNPLSSLNPADIESVEVLKDASATAIYGSRGANGVILITTKKGKSGKAKITVNGSYTIAEPAKLLPVLGLTEYAQYRLIRMGGYVKNPMSNEWNTSVFDPLKNEMVRNSVFQFFIDKNSVFRFNGDKTKLPELWTELSEVDWQSEVYKPALSQNYTMSITGGTDKTTYFVSGAFKNVNGLVRNTGLKQGDLRLNLNSQLSNSVKVVIAVNGSIKENDMMAGGNTTGGATGDISSVAIYSQPYARSMEEMELTTPNLADRATIWTWVDDFEDKTSESTFRASLDLDWKINNFLRYNLRTGGNVAFQKRSRWYNVTLYTGAMQNGYVTQADYNRENYSIENVLQFSKKIRSFLDVNAIAGVTFDDYNSVNTLIVGNKFNMYDFREKGLHIAGNIEVKQPIQRDYQLLSYLSRANLSFLGGRYLLTASIRADGSSKFTDKNRWAYFPSGSIAWRLEEEKFMKSIQYINQLKLRLGYGETGSQSIDPYSTFATFGTEFVNTPQGSPKPAQGATLSGGKLIGLVMNKMANTNLKWERTSSYNFGVDFSLFKERISGSVDIYSKITRDLLIQRDIPPSTGYRYLVINQGSLQNNGMELSLRYEVVRSKNLKWNLSGNIARNTPRILDFGLPEKLWDTEYRKAYMGNTIGDHFGEVNIFMVGGAPGLFYGYQTDGIIQENDNYLTNIKSSPGTLAPGNLKIVDRNNDGIINQLDRTVLGNPNPEFTYGLQSSVKWKDFSLTVDFNGVSGKDIFNTRTRYLGLPSMSTGMLLSDVFHKMYRNDNPWIGEYKGNEIPSATSNTPKIVLDRYIEDGSYLRCSDITLGYSLPKTWLKAIGFERIDTYASVKNPFIISNYSGYDPEVNSFAFDGTRPGIDMSSYPQIRSYIIGINLGF